VCLALRKLVHSFQAQQNSLIGHELENGVAATDQHARYSKISEPLTAHEDLLP